MTVRVNKQPFNIREKLSELERPIGIKGTELMRAETAQDARDLVSAGRKNLIINGAMEVAQRNTSLTGRTDSATVLTVDRFHHHASGGTFNTSQQTVTNGGMPGLPIKFKNYLKFDVTSGANNCGVWHTIEDVRTVQGLHTYSFYARGTNPSSGHYELDFRQYFGSGGSSIAELTPYDVVLSSEWKRYTFTFTPDSLSGKTVGAGSYYRIFLRQPDDDNTTNAYSFEITGVQLEAGGNATDFEHRSYGEELALCQRYYQVHDGHYLQVVSPTTGSNADFYNTLAYWVPMRDTPDVSQSYTNSGASTNNLVTVTATKAKFSLRPSNANTEVYVRADTLRLDAEL